MDRSPNTASHIDKGDTRDECEKRKEKMKWRAEREWEKSMAIGGGKTADMCRKC